MVFFSQNTRNCCFSFYKNSIKPSTYSVRIFTKDLELQLSKKCTNRIYYFSVSLSTSSSSFLFILYFFLFFAYLHLFWSTSSGIFYFLHNKSQFRPLSAWIIRGRQTHLLEKKYIRQYVTLWLVDFPRQNGQYTIFCSSKSVLLGERSLLRDAFPGSYLRHDSFTLTREFRYQLFLQKY